MKRIILGTCLLCFIVTLPIQALAAQIAVIDLQAILQKSNPGKKAMQILQEYQQNISSDLKEKKKSLDKLKQEFQQQRMMLSEEAKQNKRSKLQEQMQDFRSSYQQYQQKLNQKKQEIRDPIIEVLLGIVQKHGENNDYDLIIDKKNSGVMYNKESVEITETIIQRLNKAWKKRDKEIKSSKQ